MMDLDGLTRLAQSANLTLWILFRANLISQYIIYNYQALTAHSLGSVSYVSQLALCTSLLSLFQRRKCGHNARKHRIEHCVCFFLHLCLALLTFLLSSVVGSRRAACRLRRRERWEREPTSIHKGERGPTTALRVFRAMQRIPAMLLHTCIGLHKSVPCNSTRTNRFRSHSSVAAQGTPHYTDGHTIASPSSSDLPRRSTIYCRKRTTYMVDKPELEY